MALQFSSSGAYIGFSQVKVQLESNILAQAKVDLDKIWKHIGEGKRKPKLALRKRDGGCYNKIERTIYINNRTYTRKYLVHEALHAIGLKHKPGFRSHANQDYLSNEYMKRIFGAA